MAEIIRQNQTVDSAEVLTTPGGPDWWASTLEDDLAMALDASEGGLWSGTFVPPPPRPIFLEEGVIPDGVTTCDLCSWAWQGHKPYAVDTAKEVPGELGWVLTLVIVSIISAAIGAVVMITVLHCKSKMKNSQITEPTQTAVNPEPARGMRPPISPPSDPNNKDLVADYPQTTRDQNSTNQGVWSWLTSRRCSAGAPPPMSQPSIPAENHYTHMMDSENYSSVVGEALYAELDRESNASPAYQNSAYTDPENPVSSAPSSAYYSDLSVSTGERAYEVVGLTNTTPCWDKTGGHVGTKLAAICETMPSDYV